MNIISGMVLAAFPESGRIVEAVRVGAEDTLGAKTVNELMNYWARLPGHFSELVMWILNAGIYGTGIAESSWRFEERTRVYRRVEFDPLSQSEVTTTEHALTPAYDDPLLQTFDPRDFFPDHSQTLMALMNGACRRFKITASQARDRAERGVYDKAKVNRAIEYGGSHEGNVENRHEDMTDVNPERESHPAFHEMTGFRYIGKVPYAVDGADALDFVEVVCLGGETIREEVWPREMPWHDVRITPRPGSFWGISPGEVVRHDQDFLDTLKMMMADAVVKLTHPPHVYNKNADVDLSKLRAYRPTVPIGVMGDPNSAIGTPKYDPQLQPAFSMYAGVKQQMREGSSATDANQGLGLGTKRNSASEAVGMMERSAQRPELFVRLLEQEYLPPLVQFNLSLFSEFVEDTEDLARRIGKSNTTVALADIMPKYDIKLVGSRTRGTRDEKLSSFREIMAAAANPMIAPLIPLIPVISMFFDDLGQSEISAMVGNPQMIEAYMMLQQLAMPPGPQAGNGNGTTPSNPSPMTLPAQAAGSAQGVS